MINYNCENAESDGAMLRLFLFNEIINCVRSAYTIQLDSYSFSVGRLNPFGIPIFKHYALRIKKAPHQLYYKTALSFFCTFIFVSTTFSAIFVAD